MGFVGGRALLGSRPKAHIAVGRALKALVKAGFSMWGSRRARRFVASLAIIPGLIVPVTILAPAAAASPADHYSGPYFGANNLPPGCIRDMSANNPANICHHIRSDLNGLDSPQIDVLVMVPVSPTAERDMRIMRQSVEMWEGGIDYLAGEMGLDWLANGVDFHVTVDYIDLAGGEGGEFTTYPIVDPEIVVIATNPVGGVGIGIDPVDFVFTNENAVPCHGVANPFEFSYWENLPGFNSHHDGRSGTYNEDCGGSGGNICFAINGAIDPAPGRLDVFNLFDLVSHEFGHCLTLGHVGDGAEGAWGVVPTNDIMAYDQDPLDLNKCVSTLDVEAFATRMSLYLDVNGDSAVNSGDRLLANDQIGQGGNPFQVQHPGDHLYASGTGSPVDCPQPDLGPIPGPRTSWTPTPIASTEPRLTITSPQDGTVSDDGVFDVSGTVEHVGLQADPTEPIGFQNDPDDDASTPVTEILDLNVEVTATNVTSTIRLADIWPSTTVLSPTTYSLVVDGRKFSSFIRYPHETGNAANPKTWDHSAGAYMPAGTSSWDLQAKTVTFNIPRDYLATANIYSPYFVRSTANIGALAEGVVDDRAPDSGVGIGVANARVARVGLPETPLNRHTSTVTFEHPDGNEFFPQDSTLGTTQEADIDPSHLFTLDVEQVADVEFDLTWTDSIGTTDVDLYVTGAASSGSQGASINNPEHFVLVGVQGKLDIQVEPYLITEASGTTYTLTATIHIDSDGDGIRDSNDLCPNEAGPQPSGCPDGDGDGVPDLEDVCPDEPGNGADGCPIASNEHVHLYVDGVLVASQDVDTANGPDSFVLTVQLPAGTHELLVQWEDDGEILATRSVTVTSNAVP